VVEYKYEVHHIDIKIAFLNCELEQKNYRRQPKGFVQTLFVTLFVNKSLFGLTKFVNLVCLHRHVFIAKWFYTKFGRHKYICQKSGTLFKALILYIHDCIIVTNDHKELLPQNLQLLYSTYYKPNSKHKCFQNET
jgi:hypothetical protein